VAISVDTEQSPQQQVSSPENETLHRLIVAAAGYIGIETGEEIPINEIVEQGLANGHTECEILNLIEQEYDSAQTIPVPPQGTIFGEMWQVEDSATGAPTPSSKSKIIENFRDWCKEKRQSRKTKYEDGTYQHPVEHAYSYKAEKEKFARFKDVERHFLNEYSKITTVLLTYTRSRSDDESIAEHANSFYPYYPIIKKRGDCIKASGYWNEYAGISLLAPKEIAPNPCAKTHAHDMLILPSFIKSDSFDPLRNEGVDVSIRYHQTDKIVAPSSVNRLDLEQERGATTALSQEVGSNLPVLTAIEGFRDKAEIDGMTDLAEYRAKLDATHCPEYVERWCAQMSCGKDHHPDTNGIRRWRELGKFKDISDSIKDEHFEERGYGNDNAQTSLSEDIGASDDGDTRCTEEQQPEQEPDPEKPESESDESRFTFTIPDPKPETNFEFSANPTGDQ